MQTCVDESQAGVYAGTGFVGVMLEESLLIEESLPLDSLLEDSELEELQESLLDSELEELQESLLDSELEELHESLLDSELEELHESLLDDSRDDSLLEDSLDVESELDSSMSISHAISCQDSSLPKIVTFEQPLSMGLTSEFLKRSNHRLIKMSPIVSV